jgi:hypothetical protein
MLDRGRIITICDGIDTVFDELSAKINHDPELMR